MTQIDQLAELYLGGADRDQLDPILDACVALYKEQLDEDGQVDFKGKAKAFVRTYNFLAAILPYSNAQWEKLSIFLNFLIFRKWLSDTVFWLTYEPPTAPHPAG